MKYVLRAIFLVLVARPITWLVLGINLRGSEHLPRRGPAILAPNHNSHLDTLILLALFRVSTACRVRPVAASDYMAHSLWRKAFWLCCLGVIPISRDPLRRGVAKRGADEGGARAHPMEKCAEALRRGEILIVFPEGTRGEPEKLGSFKSGIAHLAEQFPDVPIIPVFLRGAGKALPRGEALFVPFICDVVVGEPISWTHGKGMGNKAEFMGALRSRIEGLAAAIPTPAWDDSPTGPY